MSNIKLPISKYAKLSREEQEYHLSNFLVRHFSHSASKAFGRNEKVFEQRYIYKERSDLIGVSVAVGNAYHLALEHYFETYMHKGEKMTAEELSVIALDYLKKIDPTKWKSEAYTPEKQLDDAIKKTNFAIQSFIKEGECYFQDMQEIISIESFFGEFIIMNGVEIPIPFVGRLDLLYVNTDGELAVKDHKSTSTHTAIASVNYKYSEQAVFYRSLINAFVARVFNGETEYKNEEEEHLANTLKKLAKKYPKIKEGVKKFWFFENKTSKNRNNLKQIQAVPIEFDNDTLRMFESYAYVNAKKLCEAVSDPDFIYSINSDDNWLSAREKNELVEFFIRTQIAEIETFEHLTPSQRQLLAKRKRKVKDTSLKNVSPKAIEKFKKLSSNFITLYSMDDMTKAQKIEHRLGFFNIIARVEQIVEGYSCDLYLLDISGETALSRLFKHRLDIAKALDVENVRVCTNLIQIDVKGKKRSFLGIEVNREKQQKVDWDESYLKGGMNVPIGVDNFKNPIYWDLEEHSTPHLLGGGATGSGKSVFIASLIKTIRDFPNCNITILDPKREFNKNAKISELTNKSNIRVIQETEEMEEFLRLSVEEMEKRFKEGINDATSREIIIFDELNVAIAMSQSKKALETKFGVGSSKKKISKLENQLVKLEISLDPDTPRANEIMKKEIDKIKDLLDIEQKILHEKEQNTRTLVENNLILLQKARSAKFNLVEFGQRLTSEVLDGNAKMNFPVRVCFYVPGEVDSRVVLDEIGAEELKGKGDGLFSSPSHPLTRFQAFYVDIED